MIWKAICVSRWPFLFTSPLCSRFLRKSCALVSAVDDLCLRHPPTGSHTKLRQIRLRRATHDFRFDF